MPPPSGPDSTPGTNPATALPLYRSARYSSYTNRELTSGTDICANVNPGKATRYYLLHWYIPEDRENDCVPITEEMAVRLLRRLAANRETLVGMEFTNIYHHLPAYYRLRQRSPGTLHTVEKDGECAGWFREPVILFPDKR